MTTNEINDQEALQVGRSILLLGLKRAMAVLQAQADTLETQLAVPAPTANGHAEIRPAMQRTMALIEEAPVNEKRKYKKRGSGIQRYWAQFTPEERTREMQRRGRITKRRRKAAGR